VLEVVIAIESDYGYYYVPGFSFMQHGQALSKAVKEVAVEHYKCYEARRADFIARKAAEEAAE
jgi:hypothetical protein